MLIKKGSTSQSVIIKIIDSTDGSPETGVTSSTSGLILRYYRENTSSTVITVTDLSAIDSAWSSGGLFHVGSGHYRLDVPDAAFATGVNFVGVGGVCTGMIILACEIQLVNIDIFTSIPNQVFDEALSGHLTSGTLGYDIDSLVTSMATTLTRLSSTRAGYLDNLSAGAVAQSTDITTLLTRLSEVRATYLDNLSAGAPALASNFTAARAAYLDYIANATYGLSALQTLISALNNISSTQVQSACDAAITANSDLNTIQTDVVAVYNKLPTSDYLTGTDDHTGTVSATISSAAITEIASEVSTTGFSAMVVNALLAFGK